MLLLRKGLLTALAVVIGALHARAQDPFPLARDPLLVSLVAEALERNPELRAAEMGLLAAQARVNRAGALPDPVIAVGYEQAGGALGRDEDTLLGLTVTQGLPFPGKRRLRTEVERKEAERAVLPAERVRRMLVARVRRAYTDLLLARENLALIEEQRRSARDLEELTRSRYAVGLANQPDVLRAQAELARLDQMRLHEEGNETSALAELNRLLARPEQTPLPTTTRFTAVEQVPIRLPEVSEVVAMADTLSPHVAAARKAVEASRAALDLAHRDRKPDFLLSAGYQNRGSIPPVFTVEVGVLTPLYAGRKQKQAVAEAEARLRADEAGLEASRLAVRARAERNLAQFTAALREAGSFAGGVLTADRLAVESTLASYKAGKVPFVSVLEAYTTLYRDRWQYLELLAHVLWHSASLHEYAAEE